MSRDLQDTVWEAAGWGTATCESCGEMLQRLTSLTGGYSVCVNDDCVTRKMPITRPCWEEPDE